jgi:hypothetical protein
MLKVKSLYLPILADDPWEPGSSEDDEIEKIVVFEEMGLSTVPTGADDKRKYDNIVVQYTTELSFLR